MLSDLLPVGCALQNKLLAALPACLVLCITELLADAPGQARLIPAESIRDRLNAYRTA